MVPFGIGLVNGIDGSFFLYFFLFRMAGMAGLHMTAKTDHSCVAYVADAVRQLVSPLDYFVLRRQYLTNHFGSTR